MKYMVMVNGKYMTQVETERSACGAEHIILDEIRYGITAAQAFDAKEMKTQFFFSCMQSCELISLDELKRKSNAVKAKIDGRVSEAQAEYDRIKAQIKELQKQEQAAWYALNAAHSQRDEDAI